jgi:hypothetical protein
MVIPYIIPLPEIATDGSLLLSSRINLYPTSAIFSDFIQEPIMV